MMSTITNPFAQQAVSMDTKTSPAKPSVTPGEAHATFANQLKMLSTV